MATTTIPVTIEADAAARVEELGMRAEFEQMIEHAKQAVSGLQFIRVTLEYDPEWPENEPRVVLWARRDDAAVEPSTAAVNWELAGWRGELFPPHVCWHIGMLACH
jgi:hypothetical protein